MFYGFGSSQALPIAFGVPLAGYINLNSPNNAGYYVCAACSILGSLTLFLVDLHKRNVSKHKDGTIKWVVRLRGKLCVKPSDFAGKMELIRALKHVESCHLTTIMITSQHCKEQQRWFLARKFWWVEKKNPLIFRNFSHKISPGSSHKRCSNECRKRTGETWTDLHFRRRNCRWVNRKFPWTYLETFLF